MKKNMTKVLSVVLVLAMVLMLGGCGASDKDALLGTWQAKLDMTDLFNESLLAGTGEEMGAYMKVEDFTLTVNLTFNSDDTYAMVLDETALDATVAGLRSDLQAGLEQYFADYIAAAGMEMSVEDMLAASNTSMEELMDQIVTQELIDTLVSDIASEGKFKAKDGKLYLSAGLEYEVDPNVYETYELNGTSLTLKEYISTEEVDDITKSMYPMNFTKIS